MVQQDAPRPEVIEVPLPSGEATALLAWPPQKDPGAPLLVWLPAMGVRADFYHPFAENLHRERLNVTVGEIRGQGRGSLRASRGTNFGYLEMLTEDLPALLENARRRYPASPVFLGGHSIGSHLGSLYLGLTPKAAEGLVMIAAGTPYYKKWDFPGSLKLLVGGALFQGLSLLLGFLPGRVFGNGDPQARQLIREWAGLVYSGKFRVRGLGECAERVLERMSAPVLSISFTDDSFAPRAAAAHLLSKLQPSSLEHQHLTPTEAGGEKMGHVLWVKASAGLAVRTAEWMRSTAGNPKA